MHSVAAPLATEYHDPDDEIQMLVGNIEGLVKLQNAVLAVNNS